MKCFTKNKWLFLQNTILDLWHGSEHTSGLLKLFCRGSQRYTQDCLIYAKLIIVFTPNWEFSPNSEIIHESTTFKLTKGYQRLKKKDNYSILCFWPFFHFLLCNAPDSKCYKQKWSVLFFTRIKLVVRVLPCARAIARIKWKRLIIQIGFTFDLNPIMPSVHKMVRQTLKILHYLLRDF